MPPRLTRLLAVVAAVGLVAGAFVVRGWIAGDDTGGGGDGPNRTEPDGDGWSVLCDADLGDACDELESVSGVATVQVNPLAEILASGDLSYLRGHDVWVTLDPVADVVRGELTPDEGSAPIASTTLAAVLPPTSRLNPCIDDDAVTWDCLLGEDARPPLGLPAFDSSLGIVTFGHAAAGLVGSTDFGDRQLDLHVDALRAPTTTSTDDLTAGVLRSGTFAGIVITERQAAATAETAAGTSARLQVVGIAGEPTIGVVVTPLGGDAEAAAELAAAILDDDAGQNVLDALAAAGYDGGPERSSGLPAPDVMYALWEELES